LVLSINDERAPHFYPRKKNVGPGLSSQRPSSVSNRKENMKMIPKLFHCLLLFFFREKEIAEMLVRIVSTTPTKRNSHDAINSGPDYPTTT
jgi:hypothetical protein